MQRDSISCNGRSSSNIGCAGGASSGMFGIASVFSATVRIEGKKLFVDIVTNIVGLFEIFDRGQIDVGEVQVRFYRPPIAFREEQSRVFWMDVPKGNSLSVNACFGAQMLNHRDK